MPARAITCEVSWGARPLPSIHVQKPTDGYRPEAELYKYQTRTISLSESAYGLENKVFVAREVGDALSQRRVAGGQDDNGYRPVAVNPRARRLE